MIWWRSLAFNIAFWGLTLLMGLCCLPALGGQQASRWVARRWIGCSLFLLRVLCGLRVEVRGHRHLPDMPAIYASKHQSALDTLVLWHLLDGPSFILKRELLWIPVFGWYLARVGSIPIRRGARTRALQIIERTARLRLGAGQSIIIFPEGTRTSPGVQTSYKKAGISLLYQQLQMPVYPVALNTGVFWARNAFLKYPGTAIIECLPPLAPHQPVEVMLASLRQSIETQSEALHQEAMAAAAV